jgi:hypothetical protein
MGQKLNLTPIGDVCGKKRFQDRDEADASAAVIRHHNRVTGGGKPGRRLGVYHCERCAAWHLGHAPRPKGG